MKLVKELFIHFDSSSFSILILLFFFKEKNLSDYLAKNVVRSNELETLKSNLDRLNSVNQNLESEKRDLLVIIDEKVKYNERLNDQFESLKVKLLEKESSICELTVKLGEMNSKEASVSMKFQSDKKRLLNEIDLLNTQLKDKSTQILEMKSEQVQSQLEHDEERLSNEKLVDLYRKEKSELTQKLQDFNQQQHQQQQQQDIEEVIEQEELSLGDYTHNYEDAIEEQEEEVNDEEEEIEEVGRNREILFENWGAPPPSIHSMDGHTFYKVTGRNDAVYYYCTHKKRCNIRENRCNASYRIRNWLLREYDIIGEHNQHLL
jgi:hypothetical protein